MSFDERWTISPSMQPTLHISTPCSICRHKDSQKCKCHQNFNLQERKSKFEECAMKIITAQGRKFTHSHEASASE